MKQNRSEKEIADEIKALEACKSYIPKRTAFGDDNIAKVNLQIEFLRGEIDTTTDGFYECSDDEQSSIREAEDWQLGFIDESPSSGWDNYKPKPKTFSRVRESGAQRSKARRRNDLHPETPRSKI